jgi:acyl-CoA synthetase (AMP-forming)/AMP-acid ligase II/fatty-acid desaturase/acyl carrier protein
MTTLPRYDETILDRLRKHATASPDQVAYRFLRDDRVTDAVTYSQLALRVSGLAECLRDQNTRGDRALLLYPPGLEFIEAFLACLAAGIIAVPAYLPRKNRKVDRLLAIIHDCMPRLVLTTEQAASSIGSELISVAGGRQLLSTDAIPTPSSHTCHWRTLDTNAVAFLQYTSGSTGTPRGVMVTHKNIVSNEKAIQESFCHNKDSIVVGWLPVFHDMGLIGNILQPLHVGFPSFVLSPVAFLQQPVRWLRAITEYRATTTGAPNFAWDHCAKSVTEEEKEGLDLSSLRIAYNGAEPVRAETIDRFTEAFARYGFRRESFFPCYGLAEATLFVAGGPPQRTPVLGHVCSRSLERHVWTSRNNAGEDTRCVVSSGQIAKGIRVEIVNPETRQRCLANELGEIWLASDSVAQGYWNKPEATKELLQALLADTDDGPFLRTGDLGHVVDGELFITGRLRDLIVIRGRNFYPQDLEAVVESVLPFVEGNSCAAFATEKNGRELLDIVIEADRRLVRIAREAGQNNGQGHAASRELAEMIGSVRQAIAEQFEVSVHSIVFVRPGSFPRTSSGKVQRHACRVGLDTGSLDLVHTCAENGADALLPAAVDKAANVSRVTDEALHELGAVDKVGPEQGQALNHVAIDNGHLRRQQQWHALAIAMGPLIGMSILVGLLWNTVVTLLDVCLLVSMYALTIEGITVGFHRHFTHKAFKAALPVRIVLAALGSMAAQAPLIYWVATHRRHHQLSDRDGDPHSPHLHGDGFLRRMKGLLYAHAGWMYFHDTTNTSAYARDLVRDPAMRRLNQLYLGFVLLGLAIPAAIGAMVTHSWLGACKGLFWGGFVRVFLGHHFTWSVNSICHAYGQRNYETNDYSVNNAWLAVPTLGESWHNNHHATPSAASFSKKWWQLDLGALLVVALESVGLVWDVKRTSPASVSSDILSGQCLSRQHDAEARCVAVAPVQSVRQQILSTVADCLREELRLPTGTIRGNESFASLGVDSVGIAVISLRLSKTLGITLSPSVLYDFDTIDRLARHLESETVPTRNTLRESEPGRAGVAIRFVRRVEELEAVYRFRYAAYVDQLGRDLRYADHEQRTVVEPLDRDGRILAAFDENGSVIGTLRTNLLRETDIGEFGARYGLDKLAVFESQKYSITTRNVIATAHRGRTLELALIRCNYEMLRAEGIAMNYAACREDLLPFYVGLGFRPCRRFHDAETGQMCVICFDLVNTEFPQSVKTESLLRQAACNVPGTIR